MIRVADCTPILLAGVKPDQTAVVAAVHAGWRGSAAGIAAAAVEKMAAMGCRRESIRGAIGPHIGTCCYEVGEDLRETVSQMAGAVFAETYVTPGRMTESGIQKYTADLTGMNLRWLTDVGVNPDRIDICTLCTMCHPAQFHSHRATGGKRGAMGAAIGILPGTVFR